MKFRICVEASVAFIVGIIVMTANIEGTDCHRTRSRYVNSTESLVAEVGQNVTMVCSSESILPSNISWFKNNEMLSTMMEEKDGFVLVIHSVTPEDAGEYQCDTDDGFNITSYSLGQLVVIGKVRPNHWLAVGLFFAGGLLVSAVFASLRFVRLRQSHYPFSYKHLCALNLCECYKKKRRTYHMTKY